MKIAIILLAFVAAATAQAGPISITNNRVGDIVTVEVHANALLTSNIETNIVSAILAMLNQQAALINTNGNGLEGIASAAADSESPLGDLQITPELTAEVQKLKFTPELIQTMKNFLKKE